MVEVFLKEMILLELVANRNKYGHILDGVKEYRSRSVVVLTPFLWFYTTHYLGNRVKYKTRNLTNFQLTDFLETFRDFCQCHFWLTRKKLRKSVS